MFAIQNADCVWQRSRALGKLLEDTRENDIDGFVVLVPEVAVMISHTTISLILAEIYEILDHKGGQDCLSRSWEPWTEQHSIFRFNPLLEFFREEKPFTGSLLVFIK
jgi:hypothetical protein